MSDELAGDTDVAKRAFEGHAQRFAAKVGVDTDVVIRATGGCKPLEVHGLTTGKRTSPLLVVDFVDTVDGDFDPDAEARVAGYMQQGWKVRRARAIEIQDA